MKKIDVYDFDKTIYKKDSTLEFYKYCLIENISLVKYIPIQICYLILFKATRKDIYKQKFFIFLREIDNIDEKIDLFWKKNINDIRFNIINGENDKIVVSASPEFLLEKICEKIGINKVIGTKVDKFTGKFYTENCYGAEKLKRLNDEENKTIIAILHDLNLSSAYCKDIILMKNGSIYSKGSVESVLTKENLKDVYEMDFEIQRLTKSNQLFFVPLVSGLLNKYK